MGLDMYLSRKTYVKRWDHMPVEHQYKVEVTKNGEETQIKMGRISHIIEEMGYWRKANHIHNWFVKNVQDGVDECQESNVSEAQIKSLLTACKEAVEIVNGVIFSAKTVFEIGKDKKFDEKTIEIDEKTQKKLHDILPTSSGFFFGGTDYDIWYHRSNIKTIKILETITNEKDPVGDMFKGDLYYQSSW